MIKKKAGYESTCNITIEIKPHVNPSSLPCFQEFRQYAERLENRGSHLILQGSYANSTETPYSDFDEVVIGDIFDIKVVEIVKEIDVLILNIDPLADRSSILQKTS
ncbi:nucleotidyltransferase domain-containing protein [archaeon]|nr:nucleotidyltransferase domain-containing protein [archaeon]